MNGTHDQLKVFRSMAKSAKLLGLAIYKIQEVWKGPDELQQANYTFRCLPKGLKFLQVVPLSKSLKVIGLVGIHNPDALCHFNSLTHCPWCEKEGQNERIVVNYLQTVHYRLSGVQQLLWLPINLIRHSPSPQLAELSTLQRGRPWWVSYVRVIVGRGQAELISLNWESEQRNPGELASLRLPCWGHSPAHWHSPGADLDR